MAGNVKSILVFGLVTLSKWRLVKFWLGSNVLYNINDPTLFIKFRSLIKIATSAESISNHLSYSYRNIHISAILIFVILISYCSLRPRIPSFNPLPATRRKVFNGDVFWRIGTKMKFIVAQKWVPLFFPQMKQQENYWGLPIVSVIECRVTQYCRVFGQDSVGFRSAVFEERHDIIVFGGCLAD